jgi:FkbM family methyltransferase
LGSCIERVFARGNRELKLEIDECFQIMERAAVTLRMVAAQVDRIAEDIPRLGENFAVSWRAILNVIESLRSEHEGLRRELRLTRESALSDAPCQVYGTPPTLRRIPRWHTYWGTEDKPAPLLRGRLDLWSSLKSPVLMRWLADLLVMIWPGNELSRVLFLTGNFEPNELSWMSQTLTNGMTMIDIGAHMGMYSMIASKLVGERGMVIAVEPSIREFQRLSFHVTLNDLKNVRCFQVAASDTSKEATLKIAWEWNSGHNTFGEFFSPAVDLLREERVHTQTVDALVTAQALDRVDLLKIDTEGHELKVLMGAVETLRRFRPYVLIEVFEETLRRQGTSVEALLAVFESHCYVLKEFSDESGTLVPFSQSTDNQSRNLVALPAGT